MRLSQMLARDGMGVMVIVTLTLCAPCVATPAAMAAVNGANSTPQDQALRNSLSNYLAGVEGSFGIAVIDLNNSRTLSIDGNTPFPAASMYKLLVMYEVYRLIARGDLSMDNRLLITDADAIEEEPDDGLFSGDNPTIEEAINAMITISSNAAASALTRQIGGSQQIEAAARRLGMAQTTQVDGELWSTPNDLAHFFQLLAKRSLVNTRASEQMLDLLLRQSVNDRLPALLPNDAIVAHKTGEVDDVRNDGGIVYGPNGSYVIVLMSRGGVPNDESWTEAVVSKMIYSHFGQ